ncbi:hypothetical protein ACFOZY_07805 [Chungangia koreensis]|uniref:Uncharacterized protein n=1 Tax=Chungangia koreensis TaxID=752657 RepID=A0ABV8X5A6_9LACT
MNQEVDHNKLLLLEQYKEIKASRRHYSSLRFALFPVYFVVQFGLMQLAGKDLNINEYFIKLLLPIGGILITYVFWTIEERINVYYKDLEVIGDQIEDLLGFDEHKVMHKLGKRKFSNNTKLSIRVVYICFMVFMIAWLVYGIWDLFF